MTRYLKNMEKEITVDNDLKEIDRINQLLEEVGILMQLPSSISMSMNLAIEEVIANIIQYGYPEGKKGQITLRISIDSGVFTYLIIDDGISYDPTQRNDVDDCLPLEQWLTRGQGLVRRTMHKVSHYTKEGKNYLTFCKRIDPDFHPEATMTTNVCEIDGVTILALRGRLDTINAPDFEKVIQPLMTIESPNIIVNCEGLSYISSSGLRVFLMLQKSAVAHKGRLILEALQPEIEKIFKMTGCSSIFNIR